ncbi:hypothetical protein QCO44_12315 [Selenomonas sputigena]|jgi:hypothetical protein|uniref:Uncharacterized protein n=1 Tax=Selenomonas sputigena TaxID=69823 RepID=A0ABV3X859_9FIRM
MISDLDTLTRLVRRHVDGLPLPSHIVRGNIAIPLASWLASLSTDRRPAPTLVSALIGHSAERPYVSEIAMTLAARIAEQTPADQN